MSPRVSDEDLQLWLRHFETLPPVCSQAESFWEAATLDLRDARRELAEADALCKKLAEALARAGIEADEAP